MYVAKHYVRVNGVVYTPGEIIPSVKEESAIRLLAIGAIVNIEPATSVAKGESEEGAANSAPDSLPVADTDSETDPTNDSTDDLETDPVDDSADDLETDPVDDSAVPNDAEIPEIDITDGIVTEQPKKRGKRK